MNIRAIRQPTARAVTNSRIATALSRYRPPPRYTAIQAALYSSEPTQPRDTHLHVQKGHIEVGPDECLFYFDHVFPIQIRLLPRAPFGSTAGVPRHTTWIENSGLFRNDPVSILSRAGLDIDVSKVLYRLREGGAFVKVKYNTHNTTPAQIEARLQAHLKNNPESAWWSAGRPMVANLVQGRPWIEDMLQVPSPRLKVEFVGPLAEKAPLALSQEEIYSLFRPYGVLNHISDQEADSKTGLRHVLVDFYAFRRAAAARNCLHGFVVDEQTRAFLRIDYVPRYKKKWIRDWILSHPRIVLPIALALLTASLVAVFDPIRAFFIRLRIRQINAFRDLPLVKWLKKTVVDLFPAAGALLTRADPGSGPDPEPSSDPDSDSKCNWPGFKYTTKDMFRTHQEYTQQIRSWISESKSTFIVVQGPRGSGKKELVVDDALEGRPNKLVIDCKNVLEGHLSPIDALASEIGYRPVLSWMNSVSGMLDMAAQGAAGIKTNFSESADAQYQKILESASAALKTIALQGRDGLPQDEALSDEEYKEAHPEKLPVVVIDNFMYKNTASDLPLFEHIASWAAQLVTSHTAHVIFMTAGSTYHRVLNKGLPNTVFRHLSLSDLSAEAAKQFVLESLNTSGLDHSKASLSTPKKQAGSLLSESDVQDIISASTVQEETTPPPRSFLSRMLGPVGSLLGLGPKPDSRPHPPDGPTSRQNAFLAELSRSIDLVGGRMTDLEFLARRIQAGESPLLAARQIIEQNATEIVKMYLLGADESGPGPGPAWTCDQAWEVIKWLARSGKQPIHHADLVELDVFRAGANAGTGSDAIKALEEADLVSLTYVRGRPALVWPGRPAYRAAFAVLVRDTLLRTLIEIQAGRRAAKREAAKLVQLEEELGRLGALPRPLLRAAEVQARVGWVTAAIGAAQAKLDRAEAEVRALARTQAALASREVWANPLASSA